MLSVEAGLLELIHIRLNLHLACETSGEKPTLTWLSLDHFIYQMAAFSGEMGLSLRHSFPWSLPEWIPVKHVS